MRLLRTLFLLLALVASCPAAETTYPYPLSIFPSSTMIASQFQSEITAAGTIATSLLGISADGTNVWFTFANSLPGAELDALQGASYPSPVGGLIAAHNSTAPVAGLEIFYPVDSPDTDGTYRVISVGTDGSIEFSFYVPNFVRDVKALTVVGISSAAAAGAAKDIDLASEYGAVGEARDANSASSAAATYTLPADKVIFELNALPVFADLESGDYAGLSVQHNTIGGAVSYLGVRLKYE
jgi:hypothetical protein